MTSVSRNELPARDKGQSVLTALMSNPGDSAILMSAVNTFSSAAVLETNSAEAFKQRQLALQRLPVPLLAETCNRYLSSISPLLTKNQLRHSARIIREFERGEGRVLQERLLRRAAELAAIGECWLEEWWNEHAYYSNRASVCFNVNYSFGLRIAKEVVISDPPNGGTYPGTMISIAASTVLAALEFREKILDRSLTPDMSRGQPQCMHQYQYVFHACRKPGVPLDTTATYSPRENQHMAVVVDGAFYTCNFELENGQLPSLNEIQATLRYIVEIATKSNGTTCKPGILSTLDRDSWAKYHGLITALAMNASSLMKLESAAFLLCLDKATPESDVEFSKAILHGDGFNRFFDKCFQLIVFANGKVGLNGEHSLTDGTTSARLCNYLVLRANELLLQSASEVATSENARTLPVESLLFESSPELDAAIADAECKFAENVGQHCYGVIRFPDFGKRRLKQLRVSPDAFAQLAIQLAYWRTHNASASSLKHGRREGSVCIATYESTSTKRFLRARTETARSASEELRLWCESMMDPEATNEMREEGLRTAIALHAKTTAQSMEGHGVDRHLLGLKYCVAPGEPLPAIFQDYAYTLSTHWTLSTSQISDPATFCAYGWGEVVPDGYGVAYMVADDELYFHVAGRIDMRVQHITDAIRTAMVDMDMLLSRLGTGSVGDILPLLPPPPSLPSSTQSRHTKRAQSHGNTFTLAKACRLTDGGFMSRTLTRIRQSIGKSRISDSSDGGMNRSRSS